MTRKRRTLIKWVLAGLLVIVLLVALDVTLLALPQPFFPYRQEFGTLAVASDRPLPPDIGSVVVEVRMRAAAMEYPPGDLPYRVFICENERLYRLFALLVRRPSRTQGFVLSLPGNIYLNVTHIRRVALPDRGDLRHWRFQGDLADAVSHEVAHLSIGRGLDRLAAARLPVWKAEGYADYQTHRAAILADSTYSLADRIGTLLDDDLWIGAEHSRRLLRWQLMTEYLVGMRGLGLRGIADDAIVESDVYAEMIDWQRRMRARRGDG
jgi:hypothetical protein